MMDPALLKQREDFKRKAIDNPVIEKRARRDEDKAKNKKDKSEKKEKKSEKKTETSSFNYKTASTTSQVGFAVLAKIVKYMRERHHRGDTHGLTLDEILDETKQLDITAKLKTWLANEALLNNPKIQMISEGKFTFKPPYHVPGRKALLKLLERHETMGLGGILYEDIEESMANAAKAVKSLTDKNSIIEVIRPVDKKKVLFFNDQKNTWHIDKEFVSFWRTVTVDNMDEAKIEDYLQRHNITSMKDAPVAAKDAMQKRKKLKQKPKTFKRLNEHLADILHEYDPDLKK